MKRSRLNDDSEFYEQCESCGERVMRYEAFKEGSKYYHPDCAGVLWCWECGEWYEHDQKCPCQN